MNKANSLPISVQLYSLRNLDGLDRQLDVVQAAGYRHVELLGSHLDDAKGTKAKLDARGLTPSSSHVGIAALRERPEAIAAASRLLGIKQLFMPAVPVAERDSAGNCPGCAWP